MHSYDMSQKILQKSSDFGKDAEEPALEGKIIQEHLENINMDAWYYIYNVYVNPPQLK